MPEPVPKPESEPETETVPVPEPESAAMLFPVAAALDEDDETPLLADCDMVIAVVDVGRSMQTTRW
jgi:hypothetical protein